MASSSFYLNMQTEIVSAMFLFKLIIVIMNCSRFVVVLYHSVAVRVAVVMSLSL